MCNKVKLEVVICFQNSPPLVLVELNFSKGPHRAAATDEQPIFFQDILPVTTWVYPVCLHSKNMQVDELIDQYKLMNSRLRSLGSNCWECGRIKLVKVGLVEMGA